MSATRQAVVLGPSFTGFGYLPDLQPFHQLEADTGMIAGIGGVAFLSPMIWGRRRKPSFGKADGVIAVCIKIVRDKLAAAGRTSRSSDFSLWDSFRRTSTNVSLFFSQPRTITGIHHAKLPGFFMPAYLKDFN